MADEERRDRKTKKTEMIEQALNDLDGNTLALTEASTEGANWSESTEAEIAPGAQSGPLRTPRPQEEDSCHDGFAGSGLSASRSGRTCGFWAWFKSRLDEVAGQLPRELTPRAASRTCRPGSISCWSTGFSRNRDRLKPGLQRVASPAEHVTSR
jgi:hypothetical protein